MCHMDMRIRAIVPTAKSEVSAVFAWQKADDDLRAKRTAHLPHHTKTGGRHDFRAPFPAARRGRRGVASTALKVRKTFGKPTGEIALATCLKIPSG